MLQTVNALILSRDSSVLLVKRTNNTKVEPWKWSLPWGRVELWETLYQALDREILEELWINISSSEKDIFFVVNISAEIQSFYFIVNLSKKEYEIKLAENELQEFKWIHIASSDKLAFSQESRVEKFVKML